MNAPDQEFWKRKIAAYLHDPPSKAIDIALHEDHVRSLYGQAGLTDEEELRRLDVNFAKSSDWTASAADRLPFPKSRNTLLSVFDGVRARFHHPLSPEEPDAGLRFHREFASAEEAKETDHAVQPVISDNDDLTPGELWRARFFVHWRLWEKFCTEHDRRFALLPADTRIPDHTIWTHMQVVSALDGCAVGYGKNAVLQPAFLKLQLGGVQNAIAEARSIRDLWSGSYLFSWLMAAGMKSLAWEIGPDAVIFPNLKGQPLFDLHLKADLWSKIALNNRRGWEHVGTTPTAQLTPNLPNVFLAIVPRDRANELAQLVETAIRNEWQTIAESVWDFISGSGVLDGLEDGLDHEMRRERFFGQAGAHLQISWQTTPWPDTLDQALNLAEEFAGDMPAAKAANRVRDVVSYATETMPATDRDGRYYEGGDAGPKTKLNNVGLGWSILVACNGWQLDAVRQLHPFCASSTGEWQTGNLQHKDSLNGLNEGIVGGRPWADAVKKAGGAWKALFKHDDWLGAATLIKRLWHRTYLDRWGLPPSAMKWPDTRQIALGCPEDDDAEQDDVETLGGDGYIAILALDGDSIGEWISGEKTPKIRHQLSDYSDGGNAVREGALRYFRENNGQKFLETNRPLSPSYHLQFSAALSNFALLCAERIVREFQGRLIYSGGDDVLAILPAGRALTCAEALRAAFRGENPAVAGISSPAPGYLELPDYRDTQKRPIPIIVPGPEADCSVGIAIAHFKSPLQDTVRAARQAEKRAKQIPQKAAVAVTILKRSGETVEWAARWGDGGVKAAQALLQALDDGTVSSKFPYRLGELMSLYRTQSSGIMKPMAPAKEFHVPEVFEKDLSAVLARQRGPAWEKSGVPFAEAFSRLTTSWLKAMLETSPKFPKADGPPSSACDSVSCDHALNQLIALCAYCGFARRQQSESNGEKPASR